MRRFLIACLATVPVFASAQAPSTPAPEQPAAEVAAAPALPVRRVILYKTGVGYFEHLGNVRNRQNITIRFTSAQLNDVLNSLTVLDLGKGQITGISYNSVAPLEQRLGALRLPLDQNTNQAQILGSLRGARVEVSAGTGAVEGRLLTVEQRARRRGDDTTLIDTISVVTDAGELRTFELSPAVRVRIVERDLRQEIGRYLDLVGSTREQDVRSMVISTAGTGERPLFVSYVSEVPIWKSTYRLVLGAKGKPLLQGWAVVDELFIVQLAKSGISAATLETALKPVLDKKAELAGLERRMEALQTERNTIGQDQQRLRENMKALRGSAEEKQLLQRYTRQLDQQETRLDTLQADVARTTNEIDKARGELGALIGAVSFDLTTR